MDIGAIFLLLAVLILMVMFISVPFMKKQRKMYNEEHEISSLLAENERILNALQELDFDNKLGKIPSEDYPAMRNGLMRKGVSILQQLDEYNQTNSGQDAEKFIEETIAARRVDSSRNAIVDNPDADEELEAMIARRKNSQKSKSAGFCPKCGNPILVSDVFCPKCGNNLK